eukprot:12113175-Heterocapsa_arctica.AAC.1
MRIVEKDEAWTTVLTVGDIDTQTPMCLVIPTKSPELDYTVTAVFKFLKRQAHTTIVLKTDGEHSIKLLSDKVAEK